MSREQRLAAFPITTVPTAGTPVQLNASLETIKSVIVQALPQNTDFIKIGDANYQETYIAPGRALTITGDGMDYGGYGQFSLSGIWIDSLVNGEGVSYMVLRGT